MTLEIRSRIENMPRRDEHAELRAWFDDILLDIEGLKDQLCDDAEYWEGDGEGDLAKNYRGWAEFAVTLRETIAFFQELTCGPEDPSWAQ